MDNILLIDGMNAMFRAGVGFSPVPKHKHTLCTGCDSHIHTLGISHCFECKSEWDLIEDKCTKLSSEQDNILIYNFFRNLRPLIEQFKPHKCFFVLEGHPKFRYELYSEYKANRIVKTGSKNSLRSKVFRCSESIIKLIKLLPVTCCHAEEYEADDVINTLCENLKDENITIISNDSDYIQILQKGYKNCRVYNPIKKEFMIAPNYHYVAWKCLNGDSADNIPGLLTPKKAEAAVLNPEIFAKFLELEENRANFNIHKQLIEFRMVPEEELVIEEGTANYDLLKEEFALLELKSIINDVSWKKYVDTFTCISY